MTDISMNRRQQTTGRRSISHLIVGLQLAIASLMLLAGGTAAMVTTATEAAAQSRPALKNAPVDNQKEQPATTRRVVIRFLTDNDFPPFNFIDEDGSLVGFNIDLARAICEELNTSCDIKDRPWDKLFGELQAGTADAVIAAHKITEEARRQVEFTDSYFHTPGRFVTRKDQDDIEISPSGLYGHRVAVARGTAHEAYLKTFFRDSPLALYETPELAREALAAGKADVLFGDGLSLAFWLNGTNSRQCCEFRGGPFQEPQYFGNGIAIAVPKSDPQIRTMINQALQKIRASGRFQELVQRYFPFRIY